MSETNGRTAWFCEPCYLAAAGRDAGTPAEDFDRGPLRLVADGTTIIPGIMDGEHECESRWIGHRSHIGCGEEEREYHTDPCEGCGTNLPGMRHAVTLWTLAGSP